VKNKQEIKRSVSRRPVSVLVLIAACLICILATALIVRSIMYSKVGGRENYDQVRSYVEIINTIRDNYVNEFDESNINSTVGKAIVDSLGDKWSYYMSPEEYELYKLSNENEYEGLGITIYRASEDDDYQIASVIAGSPAEEAGVEVGMILEKVDGDPVKDLTPTELREKILSKLNSSVLLTVSKDGKSMSISVDCKKNYKNPVSYEMKDNNVGYIKIENFNAGASDEAKKAVQSLINLGATSLVFDVRDNPGGLVSELTKLLDYLLPEGDIFVSVDRDGNETVTTSDNMCTQIPMVVLVNENTYSAAEYFAAALREYNWATIVGTQTTGKAESQITIPLSDGSAIHISSQKYLTPQRVDLAEQGGVTPDVIVENQTTASEDGSSAEEGQSTDGSTEDGSTGTTEDGTGTETGSDSTTTEEDIDLQLLQAIEIARNAAA
jgi:carboxyl-terminal processing protease